MGLGPRTSSLQQPPANVMSYFDFQPASSSPGKISTPDVYCLDAFHKRPSTPFELPPNAGIYARRALPPIPSPAAVPALRRSPSSESLCSTVPSRPCTSSSNRQSSTEKSLPPLPPFSRTDSLESVESPKGSSQVESTPTTQVSRPRAGRSISFRSLLNRHSEDEPLPSPVSSVFSGRESRTDSLVGDLTLTQVKTNGTTTSTTGRSRRPSVLSLSQVRHVSKKSNANIPALPPLPAPRKGSMGAKSEHRWGLFRTPEDDKEDIPPMPPTPGFVQELSFGQCYYFYARNCNGYVLSNGASGDACENCARSGFLGSP